MTDPVRVTSQFINIVAGDQLRPGDVISARVSEVLPGNRFRILWNGRILTAESRLSFSRGQLIRARVEQSVDGTILRLLGREVKNSGSVLSTGASPRQILSTALLRASLPLPDENQLTRMSALLGRSRGRKTRLARLYADLISRGADPSADFLEALERLLSGRRGGQPDDKHSGGRRPHWNAAPEPDLLSKECREDGTDVDPLLKLLNGSPSRADSWAYHRNSPYLDGYPVDLTWKIRGGHTPALALTVRDGERVMEFLLEGRSPVHMAVYADEGCGITPESWKLFRDRLSLMNVDVDDTILSMEESDGFTSGSEGYRQIPENPS